MTINLVTYQLNSSQSAGLAWRDGFSAQAEIKVLAHCSHLLLRILFQAHFYYCRIILAPTVLKSQFLAGCQPGLLLALEASPGPHYVASSILRLAVVNKSFQCFDSF